MSGIELIEHISRNFPSTKIVILSGFNEVEYLKKAIKNKVHDYLLKPTCMEEFHDVFNRLKNDLDEERQKLEEYDKLKRHLTESLPFMREKYLNQLINGYFKNVKEIEEKNGFYGVELGGKNYVVVILEIDNYHLVTNAYTEEKKQMLLLSVTHIANKLMQEYTTGVFFSGGDNKIIGLCCFDAGMKAVTAIILEIQKFVYVYKQHSVSAGISNEFSGLGMIEKYFKQASEAIKQKVFLGSESIVSYQDIEGMAGIALEQHTFDNEAIINAIYYSNWDELEKFLGNVFSQFESKILRQYDYIDKLCLELLFHVSRYAQQFNIRLEDYLESKNLSFMYIQKLDSLEAKKEWVFQVLKYVGECINIVRGECTYRLVEEIVAYIKANYFNNDISLEQIAEKVNKNAAYVSKLFKAETGENYVEYLTRLRIERAKELLADIGIKTYEISSMVGYADVSHFNRIFKKQTGLNPSEYRETMRKSNPR